MNDLTDLLEFSGTGVFSWKGAPRYGRQDLGCTPGGAQDRFSFRTANIMLDHREDEPALEIVHPPRVIRFTTECFFVMTGGAIAAELDALPLEQGRVYHAPAGGALRFRARRYGFRTYLACWPATGPGTDHIRDRVRGPFSQVARWPDREGMIRVLPGPDRGFLHNPEQFFRTPWVVAEEMSDMGLRLRAPGDDSRWPPLSVRSEQLVSAPVCDGTVQITPSGPIILLRERQTTGGYPRGFVVVSTDLDLLAQYAPGSRVRFRPVAEEEARRSVLQQEEDLERLRTRVSGRAR